jgi:hypothetical protein
MPNMRQSFDEQWQLLANQSRRFEITLPRHSAYNNGVTFTTAELQLLNPVQVNDRPRRHVAKIQHWHQRLAAGQ